jgi:hypothetical protein
MGKRAMPSPGEGDAVALCFTRTGRISIPALAGGGHV